MKFVEARLLLAALGLFVVMPAVGWAQTRPSPNDTLNGKVRVVPNPWSAALLSQHYAGRKGNPVMDAASGYSRVVFFNIPSVCTIRIYTIDGDLVHAIDHKAGQGHSDIWNMISDSDQYVVSGIYIYAVHTPDGQSEVGKLIIIR